MQRRQWLPLVTAGQPLLAFLSTNFFIPKLCFMKYIIGLVGMLLPIFSGAQVRALHIGDTVPDITLTNVYNYPASTIHLSDLKGKLVILDFWATWCGSCLSAFPEMHELKKTFGNDLDILFINSFSNDDEAKVNNTFSRLKEQFGTNVELPYVLKDSILSLYFPHRFIPHYVWLNQYHKVVAITHRSDVTEKNIRKFLNGQTPSMEIKDDAMLFNTEIPLLVDGNGGDAGSFLYRSVLTKYKAGLGHAGGMKLDKDGKITRLYLINTSALSLIRQAYPVMRNYKPARVMYKVTEPDKFKEYNDAETEYSFCYELICPPASERKIRQYMQADFKKFFNVRVTIENKNRDCYVLKASGDLKKILSKNDSSYSQIARDFLHKKFRGQPVSTLTGLLEDILKKPVIDETNELHKIDLDLPGNIFSYDLKNMIAFLHRNGFDLIPAVRNIAVAVISEDPKA
jgi:thiol-disulfide isomerase/thioredoxin